MRRLFKAVERAGRQLLMRLFARMLAVTPVAIALPKHRPPRFLVVRLDERVGNLLLTTPLLVNLARRYPGCEIDCLVYGPNATLLAKLPFLRHVHSFHKWRIFGSGGVAARLRALRRARYDVCFDATNVSSPSLTQALWARAAGALATVGYARFGLGRLYSAPVTLSADAEQHSHEIDLRLALLQPLGLGSQVRSMAVAPPWPPPSPQAADFIEALGQMPYVVVNLGARLAKKRLAAADYAMVANACTAVGLKPVLTWGPQEHSLLAPVLRLATDAIAAPATSLRDLACLLRGADAVVTADTGPMHLAVALGRPTCGLFVATPPHRYGHGQPPHRLVDAAHCSQSEVLAQVRAFLKERRPAVQAGAPAATAHAFGRAAELLGRNLRGGQSPPTRPTQH